MQHVTRSTGKTAVRQDVLQKSTQTCQALQKEVCVCGVLIKAKLEGARSSASFDCWPSDVGAPGTDAAQCAVQVVAPNDALLLRVGREQMSAK